MLPRRSQADHSPATGSRAGFSCPRFHSMCTRHFASSRSGWSVRKCAPRDSVRVSAAVAMAMLLHYTKALDWDGIENAPNEALVLIRERTRIRAPLLERLPGLRRDISPVRDVNRPTNVVSMPMVR